LKISEDTPRTRMHLVYETQVLDLVVHRKQVLDRDEYLPLDRGYFLMLCHLENGNLKLDHTYIIIYQKTVSKYT
jgi:hypothetical protein